MRGITLAAAAAALIVSMASAAPAQARDPEFVYQPQDTGIIASVSNVTDHVARYRIKVFRYYPDGSRIVLWFNQPFRLRPGAAKGQLVPFSALGAEPTSMYVQAVRFHWGVVGTTRGAVDNPSVP